MAFSFGEEFYNTGDSVGMQCMIVKGDTPLQITWTLNDKELVADNSLKITALSAKISVLNILALTKGHRGVYKCIAKNVAGVDVMESELKINGTRVGCLVDGFFLVSSVQ
jgi:Immunoglobulin I-set domain